LRSLPLSRAMAIALFPFRNPITDATGCLARIFHEESVQKPLLLA
jgi:hypothetical protein